MEKTSSFDKKKNEDIDIAHTLACSKKEDGYIDPLTGLFVFTEFFHLKRGKCCGSGCRHCPFNHINVKDSNTIKDVQNKKIEILFEEEMKDK